METVAPDAPELQKKSLHATEQARPDVAAARAAWAAAQPRAGVGNLVFLDETWATTAMTPLRGWSARGARCVGQAPYGHWRTTTFLCALRADGLHAPCVLNGPINGAAFRAWVKQFLVPTLRPGDIVIMDNLGSHKVAGVQEAIAAAKAEVRYLPPYSPDFNPIEQVFAKLKALLRRAASRTKDALWDCIGDLLNRFPPAECLHYIRHSGYGRSG